MSVTLLSDRAVIRLSATGDGEDAVEFLQGLVTNDMRGALPAWTGLLTPQGKALFDFIVWPADKGELLIDCEACTADELIKRLSLYRLRRKIAIERDSGLAVHWQKEATDNGTPDPRLGDLGWRWLAPTSDGAGTADAEWLVHRLSFGVAEGRKELGDILWLETNAIELGGVAFDKGCYVGQENTARMNWRQKVNRRLVVVPLDKSEPKRRKAAYPELDFAIDHLRVNDIDPETLPAWQKAAIRP